MAKTTINSDIYNLAKLVDNVKSLFIPNETEETLAISTYGYIGALESHRLQTQIQMTGELCNEVFPSRARLERNVITHAIMANIEDINAIPAKMGAFLAIKESDIQSYFDTNTNTFIIDRECPLYVGDYEFHLEYDVKLKKVKTVNNIQRQNLDRVNYAYTAQYDIPAGREVPNSTINSTNGFLSPPAIVNVNGDTYIYLTVTIAQVEHTVVSRKLVTSNIIDNKTMNFEFDNQLAYFEVHCKETDEEYYLTPIFEGSSTPDSNVKYYCWYQYLDTNLIRIRFDRKSYMPGLNATVECLIKTCQGAKGNFTYGSEAYVTLTSVKYGYKNLTSLLVPLTASQDGKDRKSKRELQGLIPKEFLSRGSLTTITDLNNYFRMINSDIGRIVIQKKIDNQIERVYYAYLVAKDANNDIIPSNTLDVCIKLEDLIDSRFYSTDPPRYILPAGACFRLASDGIAYINTLPLIDTVLEFPVNAVNRGDYVTVNFTVEVISEDYDAVSCGVIVGGSATNTHVFPNPEEERFIMNESSNTTVVENYLQMGVGQLYTYSTTYVTRQSNSLIYAEDLDLDCFDFVEGYYIADGAAKRFTSLPISVYGLPENTKIIFNITKRLNTKASGIIYFGRDRTFENNVYKFNQTRTGKLSHILNKLGFAGTVLNAESSSAKLVLTENGTILPEPTEGNPYELRVVYNSNVPDVFSRNENEWFYVVEKAIDRVEEDLSSDVENTEEQSYHLRVVREEDLPSIEDRNENEWFYVVESYNNIEDSYTDDNDYYDTDAEYILHVDKQNNLPNPEDREINNWWYSVYHSQLREEIPDPPDHLKGKEYDVEVIDNFHGSIIEITVTFDDGIRTIYVMQDRNVIENTIKVYDNGEDVQDITYQTYVPTLDQDKWPQNLIVGDRINYQVRYKSPGYSYKPQLDIELSRGLRYVPFTNTITYGDGSSIQYEPMEGEVKHNDIFLYTNPYTISINGYRLYSAFYMMSMDENPYLHFDYVNDNSNVQFIATNASWNRPLIGEDKNIYSLSFTITQSVQADLGIAPTESFDTRSEDYFTPLVKAIAVFYRDKKPYRYRSMDMTTYDPATYSYTFSQTFRSKDIFDNQNNIQVVNVQSIGQVEFVITFSYDGNTYTLNHGETVHLSSILAALGIELEDNIETASSSNRTSIDVFRKAYNEEYMVSALADFPHDITIKVSDYADNSYEIKATSKGPNSFSIRIGPSVSSPLNFTREMNIIGDFSVSELLDYYDIEYTTIKSVYIEDNFKKQREHVKIYSVIDDYGDVIDYSIFISGEIYGGIFIEYDDTSVAYQVYTSKTPEYGFLEPNTTVKIYTLCGIPDITGVYSKNNLGTICPGLENWTVTNIYDIVGGVTMYHNYSEIVGSRCVPFGKDTTTEDSITVMEPEGYYVKGIPLLGYDYCQDEVLAQEAIRALNYRKAYIDRSLELLENSFGIDFKLFNTYGPSKIYYVIKDVDKNNLLDDPTESIGRVNITLNFRIKLVSTRDSYTKDNIIKDIKEYIEDLDDISELHIPNLVTQITNSYKEQIYYFEYLGINNFGPDVQHLYRVPDDEIPIHTAPEFLNINNVLNNDGTISPDINIYISEM